MIELDQFFISIFRLYTTVYIKMYVYFYANKETHIKINFESRDYYCKIKIYILQNVHNIDLG